MWIKRLIVICESYINLYENHKLGLSSYFSGINELKLHL